MIRNLGHRKLSKTSAHRRSMLSNMACSLLVNEQVKTTTPKAKEVRRVVEGVITDAKKGDHREVRRVVRGDKKAYRKIFETIAPRYKERNGGFTRIMKAGFRKGDLAEVSIVKLV